MPNEQLGKELNDIDFDRIIGGPLCAVVKAQTLAARTTLDFVREIGFGTNSATEGKAQTVTFAYTKNIPDATGKAKELDCSLTVPLLTIIPIPYLRVEDVTIDFNATLTSCDQATHEDTTAFSAQMDGKVGFLWASVNFKASVSHQSKNTSSSKVDRKFSLAVHVHAVQDQLPAGMERVLHILETCIHEKSDAGAGGAPAAKPAAPPSK